jgi:putative DNA primase/helicase
MAKKTVKSKTKTKTSKKPASSGSIPNSVNGKRKVTPHARLADLYENRYSRNTIYCNGKYYKYAGGVWEPVNIIKIRSEIAKVIEGENGKGYRASDVDSIDKLIRALLFTPGEILDSMEGFINLRNGVFDIENQSLVDHRPDFYMTTQLPFEFDRSVKYPQWEYYLESTFMGYDESIKGFYPDKELVEFVQEAVGYSLTSDIQFHVMFWCLGSGRNGKGILFYILERLGGDSVTPLDVNLMKYNQYQLATLSGKKIALCSESNSTKNLVEDAIIKMLVAGDTMIVRQIRQEPFTLRPLVKLWWAMNRFPAVADTSEGFWRRIRIIPFNRVFTEKEVITDLKERLDPELPGIFVWAMEGLRRLQSRGHFAIPKQVEDFVAGYKLEANTVASWIIEECDISDPSVRGRSQPLYQSYKAWCFDNGYSPYGIKRYRREMIEQGHKSGRDGAGSYYEGITLLSLFSKAQVP